jgi:hypothetical protein
MTIGQFKNAKRHVIMNAKREKNRGEKGRTGFYGT